MNRKLLLTIGLVATLTLAACGNKEGFAPQIAVEQVLQNIANASASAGGVVDLTGSSDDRTTVGNSNGSGNVVTNSDGTIVSGTNSGTILGGTGESDESFFDSQVVVPEKQEASLFSQLLNKIKNPKKPATPEPTPTPTPSKGNGNSGNGNTVPSTPAPTTPTPETVTNPEPEVKEETPSEEVKEETPTETPSDEKEAEADPEPEAPVEPEEEVTYTPITVLLLNECGTEIKVVSVINPKTNEQVNLGTLDVDEMFILKAEWPSNGKSFRVAGYGADGKILMGVSLDFSSITQSAAVTFAGEGSLKGINYEVE